MTVTWRRAILDVAFACLLVFFLALTMAGCSLTQYPDVMDYTTATPPAGELSDYAVWAWSGAVNRMWGGSSGYYDLWGTASAIGVQGLSLGTVAAVGHPWVKGMALATTGAVGLAQIFKNTEHANIYDEGSNMIGDAQAQYLEARAAAGKTTIPTTCMSKEGASILFSGTNDALRYVKNMLKGLRPPTPQQSYGKVMGYGARVDPPVC